MCVCYGPCPGLGIYADSDGSDEEDDNDDGTSDDDGLSGTGGDAISDADLKVHILYSYYLYFCLHAYTLLYLIILYLVFFD